jgi:hypothetical protein
MRLYAFLVLTALLASSPSHGFVLNRGGTAVPPVTYTPLCGGSLPSCTYAMSTERQLVSGATKAFQVTRSVDSTTQDVGFISSGANTGLVNTATVDTFCNASVAGVISRNCFLSKIYEQIGTSGTNCDMYNSQSQGDLPNYMVWPAHSGLPQFQVPFHSGATSFFILDNAGGNLSTNAPNCTALTGTAQSLFYSGSSHYQSATAGNFGLQETVSAGGPQGAMFSAYIGTTGLTFDLCTTSTPCGGLDSEEQGPQANYTRTSNDDLIDIVTYDDTVTGGLFNIWINNTEIVTGNSQPDSLVTERRMSWGAAGDHSTEGPAIGRSESFYLGALTSGQVAAIYANETAFMGTLTTGYQGPGDLFGEASPTSSSLTLGRVLQMQYLSQCFSLRKCYAGYEGPALNVCQGSGSCEDIGWVSNAIDTATMSAYCGPVSGLNNCAVQIWYNEAINTTSNTNGVGTGIDATAVSSSNRPAVLWSGCGTTAITVCIQTNATNYFTLGGGVTVNSGYAMSAVAMRTGGTSSLSAIMASVSTPETFIGFAASTNTCFGAATASGAGSSVACNDNTVHSITVDAHTSPSASTITYADGVAGTANTSTIGYSATGLGVGATAAGLDPCVCQLSEVLVFADAHNASFNTTLGSTGVATLRANQRTVFGF